MKNKYINENLLSKTTNDNYMNNFPFPHCVIDGLLNSDTLFRVLKEVDKLKLNDATFKFANPNCPYEYNKYTYDISKIPQLKDIFDYLNGSEFLAELSRITGIKDIIANMKGGIKGSGVHIIKKGGYLGIHTDFNTHTHGVYGSLDRRINILIYLNPDWKPEYGGHLLLRQPNKDPNIKNQIKILPILNRCVIFSTTKNSWHGHEEPLTSPHGIHRRSIANYYYTKNNNGKKDFEGDPPHNTRWWNNNFKDMKGK